MLKKTLVVLAITATAAVAGPAAVATAATLSTAESAPAASTPVTHKSLDTSYLAPATWVWGGTGVLGISGMPVFGATIARGRRTIKTSTVSVDVNQAQYA